MLEPKSILDFMDIKFDPGEAQCSTKNVEKDLKMLSEMVRNIEIQRDDKFGAGHRKEIKMNAKRIEGLEDEFDKKKAFEDYQESKKLQKLMPRWFWNIRMSLIPQKNFSSK